MVYMRLLLTGFQDSLQYRGRLLIDMFVGFLPVAIEIVLWTAIYAAGNYAVIGGYSYSDMCIYLAMAMLVGSIMQSANVARPVANDIKEGSLSRFVLKPIGSLRYYLCTSVSECLIFLIIVFVPITVLLYVFVIKHSVWIYVVALFSLTLSYLLMYLFNYMIGMIAFWLVSITSFFSMKNAIVGFLAGSILPISFFPDSFQMVSRYLPFQYMVFAPIDAFITGEMSSILGGICVQAVWIGLLAALCKVMWQRGLKRYSAVGN